MRNVTAPLEIRLQALEERQAGTERSIESSRQRIDVTFIAVGAFIGGLIVGLAVWLFQ
jgi:hypothetical protein